jgi:cobalamin biosynthesis Mg chelatase CobN
MGNPNEFSISDPIRVRTFGQNVLICAELVGVPLETLAKHTKIKLSMLTGFAEGKGVVTQEYLDALASELDMKGLHLLGTRGDQERRRSILSALLYETNSSMEPSTIGFERTVGKRFQQQGLPYSEEDLQELLPPDESD